MRKAVVILCILLAGACSDHDDGAEPTTTTMEPLTPVTVACERYQDTADAIVDAQTELFVPDADPAERSRSLQALASELTALKEGAPADVQTALDGMIEGFQRVEALLADPTTENQAAIGALTQGMSTHSQTIAAYVLEQCGT